MEAIDHSTGELGFADFGDAIQKYVIVHDAAVTAHNTNPNSMETLRLTESERAARESVLRFCLKIGRELNEKSRVAGRPGRGEEERHNS